MAATYNLNVIKRAVKLLKEYEAQEELCASEFINTKNLSDVPEESIQVYIMLTKHMKFFEELLDIIWTAYNLRRTNKWTVSALILMLVFVLNDDNSQDITSIFKGVKLQFTSKVIEFFLSEENLRVAARVGCKYFGNEYILNNVVYPVLNKYCLIKNLYVDLAALSAPSVPAIEKTKLKHYPFHKTVKEEPEVPKFGPAFKARGLPHTTYHSDRKLQNNLARSSEENWANAVKLLAEANQNPFKCAVIEDKPRDVEEKPKAQVIKASKLPKFKDHVEIKKTTAVIMREAAVLAKDRESALKKLEDLLSGAFDEGKIEALEVEMRKAKEQENVQDIERKHLQGLLTFEEALLAKKRLLEGNREKMEGFKDERVKLMQEFLDWKEAEQKKIRGLVEKGHSIDRAAKEAERRLLEEKQTRAKSVENESKRLLQEAYLKKERELAEKMRLIREFRALQQVRLASNVRGEFDPTECPNLGLFCEMSIAELRERLALLKIAMREELEERRGAICEERQRKELLVDSAKEFISQARMSKPKPVPSAPPNVEQTPDIIALREKLQQARRMRMNANVCKANYVSK